MTSGSVLMTPASRRYSRRYSLDLADEAYRELALAAASDDLKTSARLRALIQLWRDDPDLQERALKLGLEIQASDRRPSDMT